MRQSLFVLICYKLSYARHTLDNHNYCLGIMRHRKTRLFRVKNLLRHLQNLLYLEFVRLFLFQGNVQSRFRPKHNRQLLMVN